MESGTSLVFLTQPTLSSEVEIDLDTPERLGMAGFLTSVSPR